MAFPLCFWHHHLAVLYFSTECGLCNSGIIPKYHCNILTENKVLTEIMRYSTPEIHLRWSLKKMLEIVAKGSLVGIDIDESGTTKQMHTLFTRRIIADIVVQLLVCALSLGGGEHTVLKLEINDSNQDIKNLFRVNFNEVSVVTPR